MQNPHLLRCMTSTFSNPPCCPPHCKLRPAGAESPESYEVTWHQAVGIGLKFGISSKSKKHMFGCWACRISKERSQLLIIGFYFHDEDVIYVMFGTKQKWSLRANMSKPYNTRDDSPATSVFTPVACYEMNGGHVLPSMQKTPELTTSTQDLTMESTTQLWHFGTWASWAEACM